MPNLKGTRKKNYKSKFRKNKEIKPDNTSEDFIQKHKKIKQITQDILGVYSSVLLSFYTILCYNK